MKRCILYGLLAVIISAFTTSLVSCDKVLPHQEKDEVVDTTLVNNIVDEMFYPEFTSFEEFVEFRTQMIEDHYNDSLIRCMPTHALINVTNVLLKRHQPLSVNSVAKEYRANKKTYDDLPQSNNATQQYQSLVSKAVDLGATDLGNRSDSSIISENTAYRYDTVNGKSRKVEIKTTEKYVN